MEELIKKHEKQIGLLLYRRRIKGPVNMETITQAHNKYGNVFMMELLKIITPDQSNFTPLLNISTPGGIIDQAIQSQQAAQQTTTKGKFWNFWDNLLNRVDSTGKVIGQFKTDASGNSILLETEYQHQQQLQKTVVIIAGVIILALVAVLIFKKK